MAGYRCVNYYDLCRLCLSAGNNNVQIVNDSLLQNKIAECLPITVNEKDKLPKLICTSCKEYVEIFFDFRKACLDAQKLLTSCLNSTKLKNGSQVYIKDEIKNKKVLKPIQSQSPTKIVPAVPNLNVCNIITTTPSNKHQQIKKTVVNSPNQTDFLSSIMQAVGIQTKDEVTENDSSIQHNNTVQKKGSLPTLPHYTLTLDALNAIKTSPIQYKIENAGSIIAQSQNPTSSIAPIDEQNKLNQKCSLIMKKSTNINPLAFTRIKKQEESIDKNPKVNLILQTTPPKQHSFKINTEMLI